MYLHPNEATVEASYGEAMTFESLWDMAPVSPNGRSVSTSVDGSLQISLLFVCPSQHPRSHRLCLVFPSEQNTLHFHVFAMDVLLLSLPSMMCGAFSSSILGLDPLSKDMT